MKTTVHLFYAAFLSVVAVFGATAENWRLLIGTGVSFWLLSTLAWVPYPESRVVAVQGRTYDFTSPDTQRTQTLCAICAGLCMVAFFVAPVAVALWP